MSDRIERQLVIAAPPEEVWRIVTAAGWLADELMLELKPGGDARFRCGAQSRTGWVEDAVEAERLAFWWAVEGEPATRVELTLTPDEGATVLRVVETRPLDLLDLVGIPLPGPGGKTFGPALVAA